LTGLQDFINPAILWSKKSKFASVLFQIHFMGAVCITGIGIISAVGNNVDEVLESLLHSQAGIGPITHLDTLHKGVIPVGEVKWTDDELKIAAGIEDRDGNIYTRTSLLGMLAAREAIKNAGIDLKGIKAGLISATSVGGMNRTEYFFGRFLENRSHGRMRDVVAHDCGESTERIAEYIGATRIISTISTACSSSANSVLYGARLIRNGLLDCVVAGGADALTCFTLNGFNTLMILDKQPCRPFDDTRAGLNLGEGAGFIVMESEKHVKARGAKILCRLAGYANANDAYHQTASSPEGLGATMAMKRALAISGLSPDQIDYVNVHGTGTQNNDLSEGTALRNIFGEKIPPFSSTKAFTGHTLGAAGGVEAVLSILSIGHGMIYPNLNFSTPMKELGIIPNTRLVRSAKVRNVLSNSFGFGGNNSTLIFSGENE
jgi:3-oxoacyl-(acyl-carrier-protein) synthase